MSHGNKTVKRKCINNDSLFSWKSFFLVVAYHLLFLAAALICKYSGLNDLERTIPFVYAIPASITIGYYLVALLIKRPRRRNPSKKNHCSYSKKTFIVGLQLHLRLLCGSFLSTSLSYFGAFSYNVLSKMWRKLQLRWAMLPLVRSAKTSWGFF